MWKALYTGLSKYHEILFERKKLVNETSMLYEKNAALKRQLQNYLDREDNRYLLIPPYLNKEDKIKFALSDLGSNPLAEV